jgi:hypothetical protein
MILGAYKNYDGIHINIYISITVLYIFHHHLCAAQESHDDGSPGPKHFWIITVNPTFITHYAPRDKGWDLVGLCL